MKTIFSVVLGATMLVSGASLASDLTDYAVAQTPHPAPAVRIAEAVGTKAAAGAEAWTIDIVDPATQAGHHMPSVNRDTDPAAVDREIAANPGLAAKLREMKIDMASIQAISVKDMGTGTSMATVFVR